MATAHSQTVNSLLAANLAAVRERIWFVCAQAGRDPHAVRLVAVVKYAEWDWIRGLIELGVRDLGENRPQQLLERAARLAQELPGTDVRWHLIGHLQRNKVRAVLPATALIHSVDSLRLLERIELIAGELALRPRVLLEVNVSGEASKDGFTPERLRTQWSAAAACRHVELAGLMTMAPESADPEASRPTFDGLRGLRDELAGTDRAGPLPELSMGMSGDFETAIAAGATLVRVGSRLFEGLAPGGDERAPHARGAG